MIASLRVAALRAWLGQEEEFSAVRRRALALARGTDDAVLASASRSRAASSRPRTGRNSTRPSPSAARRRNPASRRGTDRIGCSALGMSAYRAGDDPACDAALLATGEAGKGIPEVTITSAFYRAMSLHRRGRPTRPASSRPRPPRR